MVKEESLLLRSLVLVLASIALISLDLAVGSSFSPVIMPLCVMGSLWSYVFRHLHKNMIAHIALIGGVLIFSYYWVSIGQFDHSSADAKSWVSAIGISVIAQTIGLWLAYFLFMLNSSVWISSFQMIVAILLAHNVKFVPLLVLFLLVLGPTLTLIYRSKIRLPPIGLSIWPIPKQLNERHFPWWYITKITVLALLIGSVVGLMATALPRFSTNIPNQDPLATKPKITLNLTSSQTSQAVQNILATADRSLNTPTERVEYVANYLQNHTQPGTCEDPDHCAEELRQKIAQLAVPCPATNLQCQQSWNFVADQQEVAAVYDQLTRSPEAQAKLSLPVDKSTASELPKPSIDLSATNNSPASTISSSATPPSLAPAVISQPVSSPHSASSAAPLAPSETASASINYNPTTNKYEIATTTNNATNSNASESLLNNEAIPPNQSVASPSHPVSNIDGQKVIASPASPIVNGSNAPDKNYQTSQPNATSSQPLPPTKNTQVSPQAKDPKDPSGKLNQTNQPKATPPPRSAKNKWLKFLLAAIPLLLMILGGIWYFKQQRPQQLAAQRKKSRSQSPRSIEEVYESMLQELRLGGKVKLPHVTETEFMKLMKLYYPGALSKVINEISGDYVAWYYGRQPANEVAMIQNLHLFCQLHSQIQNTKLATDKAQTSAKK
jgi:hypothetical protein